VVQSALAGLISLYKMWFVFAMEKGVPDTLPIGKEVLIN